MSLFRKIESLKIQIIETERLLEMVIDHPLMSEGFKERLNELKTELGLLPKESFEPKVQLLFSGKAVVGSQGIKSTFLTKTLNPFQEMVKTQTALVRFGQVGRRGQTKIIPNTDLYLTALPVGSFGVELSQLESNDLFDSIEVAKAMKGIINLILDSSTDDESFEKAIEKTPRRNLNNLKKFFQEIYEEQSVLKMECGELGIELSTVKVIEAYQRVAATIDEEEEIFVEGTFRGILLDSGKFEIQDSDGIKISGFISEDLSEEELIEYDKNFLNNSCIIHLRLHRTTFKTGNEKISYELLEIKNK